MYTKETLRRIFQSPFDRDEWNEIIRTVVRADELLATPEQITDPAECARGYYLGAKNTADSYRIGLFLYEVGGSNVARKRVGLRNLVRTFINPRWGQFDAALAVFTDGSQWRLSFISDIKGEATSPKRYTFVFGETGNLYRTAIERFQMLQDKGVTFETLKEAFSVEALSKEFFDQYKEHYLRFCEHIYGHAHDEVWFGKEFAVWNEKGETQKFIRDYVKNLLGRIVFLQFLQKKGWLGVDANSTKWTGGDTNFMYNLFAKASPAQKDNFLDEILEPLFFDCINTRREGDVFDTKVAGIGRVRIPYLNGGLFEQKDIDRPKSRFPRQLFADLLEFFTQYNFTIDENDPNDAEIGVDPEMLGKIFENLLEDNKDKGAFYTPKEIVQYMCRESIDAYLRAHLGGEASNLANDEVKARTLDLLRSVKVCDPAIGSGAFPMGILNELLHRRIAQGETVRADIKREIIQQNIYGVDIERGAVDIARLRFWLALVVDSAEPEPLPNLDYKIMQGNSLLEQYKGVDLSQLASQKKEKACGVQLSWLENATDVQRRELNELIQSYYTKHENKARLREDIKQNVLSQLHETSISPAIINELAHTDLHANPNFFLWHAWFADVFQQGGFDIVIGNPPYINVENIAPQFREKLFEQYSTCIGRTDIYVAFIQKSISLLNEVGSCSYIIPYPYTNQNYASKSRQMLVDNYSVQEIVDTSEYNVFDSAQVKNIILRFGKQHQAKTLIKRVSTAEDFSNERFQNRIVETCMFATLKNCRFETKDILPLLGIKRKLESDTVQFGKICLIAYGVRVNHKTDKSKPKSYYIHKTQNGNYKPFTEGRNIQRYSYTSAGFLDYRPTEHYNPMFKELFENEKLIFILNSAKPL